MKNKLNETIVLGYCPMCYTVYRNGFVCGHRRSEMIDHLDLKECKSNRDFVRSMPSVTIIMNYKIIRLCPSCLSSKGGICDDCFLGLSFYSRRNIILNINF